VGIIIIMSGSSYRTINNTLGWLLEYGHTGRRRGRIQGRMRECTCISHQHL